MLMSRVSRATKIITELNFSEVMSMPNICEECDYGPALCDGDALMCFSAMLYGYNSEKGRDSVGFDDANFSREFKL